jgi:hypothetical protein
MTALEFSTIELALLTLMSISALAGMFWGVDRMETNRVADNNPERPNRRVATKD